MSVNKKKIKKYERQSRKKQKEEEKIKQERIGKKLKNKIV